MYSYFLNDIVIQIFSTKRIELLDRAAKEEEKERRKKRRRRRRRRRRNGSQQGSTPEARGGVEPPTFRFGIERATPCATGLARTISTKNPFFIPILLLPYLSFLFRLRAHVFPEARRGAADYRAPSLERIIRSLPFFFFHNAHALSRIFSRTTRLTLILTLNP